jgi:hypothetical protein
MAQVSVHRGPYTSIPSDTSPGLRFLKGILQALDSLEPPATPIGAFLSPSAQFIINGGKPIPSSAISSMLSSRREKLIAFRHDVTVAWDVEKDDGKRTVMYESVSITVFKSDPENQEVKVPEFNVIELDPNQNGREGFVATELRSYMDTTPITQRAVELQKVQRKE